MERASKAAAGVQQIVKRLTRSWMWREYRKHTFTKVWQKMKWWWYRTWRRSNHSRESHAEENMATLTRFKLRQQTWHEVFPFGLKSIRSKLQWKQWRNGTSWGPLRGQIFKWALFFSKKEKFFEPIIPLK
jgi:hypothetical protein